MKLDHWGRKVRNLEKLGKAYDKLEEYVLVASLVFTVSIIFYQVVMRFVFNDSPSWTEEVARYMFIWQIWLGASAGLREGNHIRLTLISEYFINHNRLLAKNILELIVLIIWIALTIFLTIGGISVLGTLTQLHAVSAGMRLPLVYVYAALPVCCGIATLRIASLIYAESKKMLKGGVA